MTAALDARFLAMIDDITEIGGVPEHARPVPPRLAARPPAVTIRADEATSALRSRP